jgi:hypothetical protein
MWCKFTGWVVIMSEFKVGDRVYCPAYSLNIEVVIESGLDNIPLNVCGCTFKPCGREYNHNVSPVLFHATPENYERLSNSTQAYSLKNLS